MEKPKLLAREQMISNYHPVDSYIMASSEKGRVVDEKLKVHGVKNPGVVDASVLVMPRATIITGVYPTAES